MRRVLVFILAIMLLSCKGEHKDNYTQSSSLPELFPDYTNITIPCNIAPLNFYIPDAKHVSIIIKGEQEYRFSKRGPLMDFPMKRWKLMLEKERGKTLEVCLKAVFKRGEVGFPPFTWVVSTDSIDRYMSYRLIEPAYEVWNRLQIYERSLETFDLRLLGDNNITDHSCINCHTSNHASIQTTFMHIRGKNGGTVYSRNGVLRKIETKTEKSGPAVYGDIEGSGRYGVFTTAAIMPILHSCRCERLEVFDKKSDLILIDFIEGTVTSIPLACGDDFQETFPCFSSDGKTIFFCRAPHMSQPDSTRYMHYDLYKLAFDPANGKVGDEIKLILDASGKDRSVSFPRCSPDGKRLLFSVSEYGTFPIWHVDTDMWMMDLSTGKIDSLDIVNGRYSDSYHSWSSNSRWIAFATKRDDRVYGRPYFAHVDDRGRVSKPFLLPQRDPESYLMTLKSYNIPEMYKIPEIYDARRLRELYFNMEKEIFRYKN